MNSKSIAIALSLGLGFGFSAIDSTALQAQPKQPSSPVPPAQTRSQATMKPPYNCRTREVWSAEKKAWCQKVESLKNATYQIPDYGTVKMTNGRFEKNGSTTGERWAAGVTDMVVFDNLADDKTEDAAVLLWVNSGGSGQFTYLAVVKDVLHSPKNVSTVLLGDRVKINTFSTQSGRIDLNLLTQGANDPLCCPTQEVSQSYTLQNDRLELLPQSSTSSTTIATDRNAYRPINLESLKVSLTGNDPRAIALAAFGMKERPEGRFKETVTVNTPNPKQSIVFLTQMNLPDDSVRGLTYRIEFEAVPNVGSSRWRMVWAGKQHTCWQGRGSQNWTTESCI
jgi:hypothetical protein